MNQTVFLIAAPLFLLLMFWRLRRLSQARPLRVERMWIVPLFFAAVIGLSIYAQPPEPSAVIYGSLAAAFVAGIGLGWFRGRMVRISINVETHELTSQQSPWGMMIFVVILVLRSSMRFLLARYGGDLHLSAGVITAIADGSLLLYGGMIVGMRIEMWQRAQKLLAGALAQKAAGKTVQAEVSQDHA